MITKNQIAIDALSELRISGITVQATPTEISDVVSRLDIMMLDWENEAILLGYKQPVEYGQSNPLDDSGLSRHSIFAVTANLAKILCARYGKMCHVQTLTDAKNGKDALYNIELPQREPNPYQPLGSGEFNGYHNDSYCNFQQEEEQAPTSYKTLQIKSGQTNEYSIDFNLGIPDGDTIGSFTVENGEGVEVLESSESDGFITLKCKGSVVGLSKVKITITYDDSGLVNPYTINFNVTEA